MFDMQDPERTRQQKEQIIRAYFEDKTWDEDMISIDVIKQELSQHMNEKPAVELIFKKDSILNEASGELHKMEYIDSVNLTYTIGEKMVKESSSNRLIPSFITHTTRVEIGLQ